MRMKTRERFIHFAFVDRCERMATCVISPMKTRGRPRWSMESSSVVSFLHQSSPVRPTLSPNKQALEINNLLKL
jgi:hypothetical protein